MGRRQVQKHTRHSSPHQWEPQHFRVRRLDLDKGTDKGMDKGKDKMGAWTYGTRCRLATSTYSFRFTLALGAHHLSGTG